MKSKIPTAVYFPRYFFFYFILFFAYILETLSKPTLKLYENISVPPHTDTHIKYERSKSKETASSMLYMSSQPFV